MAPGHLQILQQLGCLQSPVFGYAPPISRKRMDRIPSRICNRSTRQWVVKSKHARRGVGRCVSAGDGFSW